MKKIFLSIFSIFLALAILEIITRFILHPSDSPDVFFDQYLGNQYTPNQKGFYIKQSSPSISANFRINNLGWNSPYDYQKEKNPDIYRIAIIGDSFVEGLQVDHDKSFPYLLESLLKNNNLNTQVYSFGHSGANPMQYLKVFEYVKKGYEPNLIIVNLVDNDYKEVLQGIGRKDNWTAYTKNDAVTEVAPLQTQNLWSKRILRQSALIRYMLINKDLLNRSQIVSNIYHGDVRSDISQNQDQENIVKVFNYIFEKMKYTSANSNLLITIDADRQAVYHNGTPTNESLNKLLEICRDAALSCLDLTSSFAKNWNDYHNKFEWPNDNHWNATGHLVVATAINDWIATQNEKVDQKQ